MTTMDMKTQTNIVISHRNEESAFMLRLFFSLKGFQAVIQKSIDQALVSNSRPDSGTVLVCDASDQTLLRAAKTTGQKLQNVVVIRDQEQIPSGLVQTDARIIAASTIGQDLIAAVCDCSDHSDRYSVVPGVELRT